MDLILGQLVYTSFAGIGFRTLASAKVPKEIQQAFIQRVVSQYWDSYNPPRHGYRAVYLHQVAPEHTLFGWLYNDGGDDLGRTHVPYFICYYVAELLYAFQLENLFTWLHNGPVAFIDRHSLPVTLETKVVPDLCSYQSARPGVAIPSGVRKRKHIAFKQGELLDLFVPADEQQMVIELKEHPYEQQTANSIYTCYIIEGFETGAAALNEYEQALDQAMQLEYPISNTTRNRLQRLQQVLRLTEQDIKQIEARLQGQTKAVQSQKLDAIAITSENIIPVKALNEAIAVNEADTQNYIGTGFPQIFSSGQIEIDSPQSANHNSILAYRNSQLLLKVGICASILALIGSTYGLLQTSTFAPSKPDISLTSSPVFYKTLAEVPNVPQGLFNYGGSTTFAPLRSTPIGLAIKQAHPKFQLRYEEPLVSLPGSGTGIKMLLAGKLSFVQSSRPLKNSEFVQAEEHGFTLKEISVAIDGIALYVNPQVSIPGLNLSQVRDIFTGKITNWKLVGGADLQITPFSRNLQASGTVDLFKEKVLLGEKFSTTVEEVKNTTESIRKVAKTPGGIGYATASEVTVQYSIHPLPLSRGTGQAFVSPLIGAKETTVNKTAFANGSYPLTRPLFVIIKRDGRLGEQAGIAYANLLLTNEGQQLVEQAGFVPIR